MGMNIHIKHKKGVALKPLPDQLACTDDCFSLPRFADSPDFMREVWTHWEQEQVISECQLNGPDPCSMCICDLLYRPLNIAALREAIKDLQPIFQDLVDYLESEPNAYLSYS